MRTLTIREICERALRKIGAFAIRDTGADSDELEEARFWLDMLVGHVSARRRYWWLAETAAVLALTPGVRTYTLDGSTLGQDAPAVAFPISAFAIDPLSGRDGEIDIYRRRDYDALTDKDLRTGPPEGIYIDRLAAPTLTVYPLPPAATEGGPPWRIRLVYQQFTDDVTVGEAERRIRDVRSTWNLFLVTALAAQIGDGPIRKLPQDEVRGMRNDANQLLSDLDAFDAHEQANEPRRTSFNDF
jgi:hypothetical protein